MRALNVIESFRPSEVTPREDHFPKRYPTMTVHEILLVRHANRLPWTLNPQNGSYTNALPYPTGLPADPPLSSSGVSQSEELGIYLSALLDPLIHPNRLQIYSSPFYRCLETLKPTVEKLKEAKWEGAVKARRGLGEWFGKAEWKQPVPEMARKLRDGWFLWLEGEDGAANGVVPGAYGEGIKELHERVGRGLEEVFREVEGESGDQKVTLLICFHAAGVIAAGRMLTGRIPSDWSEPDFKCFTAGVSRFVRKEDGKGGLGEWTCTMNSGCEHLSQGEERGWGFQGEESFDSMATVEKAGEMKGEEGSKL